MPWTDLDTYDGDWARVSFLNEFHAAALERYTAANGISDPNGIGLAGFPVVEDQEVSLYTLIRQVQSWLQANRTVQSHDVDGTPRGAGYWTGSGSGSLTAGWTLAALGQYVSGNDAIWRRAAVAPDDPAFEGWEYGLIQADDIIGAWIFQDLQKAMNAALVHVAFTQGVETQWAHTPPAVFTRKGVGFAGIVGGDVAAACAAALAEAIDDFQNDPVLNNDLFVEVESLVTRSRSGSTFAVVITRSRGSFNRPDVHTVPGMQGRFDWYALPQNIGEVYDPQGEAFTGHLELLLAATEAAEVGPRVGPEFGTEAIDQLPPNLGSCSGLPTGTSWALGVGYLADNLLLLRLNVPGGYEYQ